MSSEPSILLSIGLISLTGMMVLIPPLAFFRGFLRFGFAIRPGSNPGFRAVWAVVGLVPFGINLGYMTIASDDLRQGQIVLDENLAVAVLVAWGCFWARVAMGRRGLKRRRTETISPQ